MNTLLHADCGGTLTLEIHPLGWSRSSGRADALGLTRSDEPIEVARCDRCRLVGIPAIPVGKPVEMVTTGRVL